MSATSIPFISQTLAATNNKKLHINTTTLVVKIHPVEFAKRKTTLRITGIDITPNTFLQTASSIINYLL